MNEKLDQYRADVSRLTKVAYGITWQDACGDDEPLLSGIAAGYTPVAFVEWWGEKYDLTAINLNL